MIIPGPSEYLRSFAAAFIAGAASTVAVAAFHRLLLRRQMRIRERVATQ